MSSHLPSRPGGNLATAWGVIGIFTAAYIAFHLATHSAHLLELATGRLLHGETHWVTFQNRLLGPAVIDAIRLCTGWSWLRAFYVLAGCCSFAAGAIFAHRAWRSCGDAISGLGAAAVWFLLAVFFNHEWSYPWDFLGAILNLLLLLWVYDHYRSPGDLWSWHPVILLFALMMNRESSLIALVSLALMVMLHDLRRSPGPALRAIAALTAAAIGNVALIITLRRSLFVVSTRPASSALVNETSAGNFLQLRDNVDIFITERLPIRLAVISIVAGLALLGLAGSVCYWRNWRATQTGEPGLAFALFYLLVGSAALAVFACASEFRVYYELIPVCIVLALSLRQPVATGASV